MANGYRIARIETLRGEPTLERVRAYLPRNFEASTLPSGDILITGTDNAGWTMADYVIPRLASGLIFAKECETGPTRFLEFLATDGIAPRTMSAELERVSEWLIMARDDVDELRAGNVPDDETDDWLGTATANLEAAVEVLKRLRSSSSTGSAR